MRCRLLRAGLPPEKREQASDQELISGLFPNAVPESVQREFVAGWQGAHRKRGRSEPGLAARQSAEGNHDAVGCGPSEGDARRRPDLELDEKTQKPVLKIAEGTVLELDPQSAQEQIASGNVEKVVEEGKPSDQVYMRELRDYARVYRDMNLQIEELVRTTAEVNRQSAAVTDSQQKVTSDIAYRKSEQTALTHDLAHYAAEQKLITGHAQALDSLIADIAAKVTQIKASNQQLESQLAALAQQAMQFMNQRAAAPNSNGT